MLSTGTQDRPGWVLPLGIASVAAALFLLFVYGYPRLFPAIDSSTPEHFAKNATEALAAGDEDRALKIAVRATEVRPLDPMAYTVFGRMLLASGKPEGALAQLTNAVNVQKEIVEDARRRTREPFFFVPARLTLAQYHAERNRLDLAAVNFEFARAGATAKDAEYAASGAAQYRAYAGLGLWARALEFGEPSDEDLGGLDSGRLARLALVAEGRQDWKLVGRLADRLLARAETAAQAHYLLGRMGLVQGEPAAAAGHLEQAVAGGFAEAAYFRGVALEKSNEPERALQAFVNVTPENVYQPFALAKAMAILATLPEDRRASATATREELLAALDDGIARMRLRKAPVTYDTYGRLTPLAFATSQTHFAAGGRFPVLILWEDGQAPAADPAQIVFNGSEGEDNLLLRRGASTFLQLQWVENRVLWDGVEQLAPNAAEVPGWIDTARDWFSLRPGYAPRLDREDTGNAFLSLPKVTWLCSVPVPAREGMGYLFAGRVKGLPGKASLTWQAYDEEGQVLFEDDIAKDAPSPDVWTWLAAYRGSQLSWDSLRVQLSVLPRAGEVGFDDVMLAQIREPDPTLLD